MYDGNGNGKKKKKGNPQWTPMAPSKVYMDGKDVSTLKSGTTAKTGKTVPVPKKKPTTAQYAKAKNPGATMKVIRSSKSKKTKSTFGGDYMSTRSKKGKAKKRKY